MTENSKKSLSEMFRWVTPLMVTLAIWYLSQINATTNKIDDKLFKHLTNDEIHTPRSAVVDKGEFALYQSMRDRQMNDIKDTLNNLRDDVKCLLQERRK